MRHSLLICITVTSTIVQTCALLSNPMAASSSSKLQDLAVVRTSRFTREGKDSVLEHFDQKQRRSLPLITSPEISKSEDDRLDEDVTSDDDGDDEDESDDEGKEELDAALGNVSLTNARFPVSRLHIFQRDTHALLNSVPVVGSWNQTTLDAAFSLMQRISETKLRFRCSILLEQMIHRIVQEQAAGNSLICSVQMIPLYETLVASWARSGDVGGLERAEEILEFLVTQYQQDLNLLEATREREENDGEEHDHLCLKEKGRPLGIEPFNAIVWAHARSNAPAAPDNAIRFLAKWFDWYRDGYCLFAPNTTAFAAILYAYAHQDPSRQNGGHNTLTTDYRNDKEALPNQQQHHANDSTDKQPLDNPQIILDLLDGMEKLSEQFPSVKPDLACYHKYFVAIRVAFDRGHISRHQGALLAETHLARMLKRPHVHPDAWAFNSVLWIWGKSSTAESVKRCEAWLKLQEKYHLAKNYSADTKPMINGYNILVNCLARSRLKDKAERAYRLLRRLESDPHLPNPNGITYNSVMNAYSKTGKPNAPAIVEQLLLEMDRKHHEGNSDVRVNVRAINVFLDTVAKSGQANSVEKIQAWLTKMRLAAKKDRTCAPTRVTYNAYIQALAKSGREDAIDKALAVVEEIKDLHEQGFKECKPDIITYTNVLHCIATSRRHDGLERSLELLDHLEELHAAGDDIRPSRLTYNCCVNAAAKSPRPGKAKIALSIVRKMEEVGLGAGTITYNNVLNACAFSTHPLDDHEEVLQIALDVLNEARITSGAGANHITYMTMLRVVNTQVADEEKKWNLVRIIVEMCAEDGQLTANIMHGAKLNVSQRRFQKLLKFVRDTKTGGYKNEFVANVRLTTKEPRFASTAR